MWNKKRLDDLEKRITAIEDKRIYIPTDLEYPGYRPVEVTISETLRIILDYLRIRCKENPGSIKTFGRLEDTHG